MRGDPFGPDGMIGLHGRVLRIRASDLETPPGEPRGHVAASAGAKRRRILEEARSAVLERIRRVRAPRAEGLSEGIGEDAGDRA